MNKKIIISICFVCVFLSCNQSTKNAEQKHYSLDSLIELKTPDAYTAFSNMANEPKQEMYDVLKSLLGKENTLEICSIGEKVIWDVGFSVFSQDSIGEMEISTFVFDLNNSLTSNKRTYQYVNDNIKKLRKSDFGSLGNVKSGYYHFAIKSELLCDGQQVMEK